MLSKKSSVPKDHYSTNFKYQALGQTAPKKIDNKEIDFYIERLKKISNKGANPNAMSMSKNRPIDTKEYMLSNKKIDIANKKVRQKLIKRTKRSISDKRSSVKRSSKNGKIKSNVYDSFSMSNGVLDITSTPENNSSYMDMRKSYMNNLASSKAIRIHKVRQSESTQPMRKSGLANETPKQAKNAKSRASSNPRMNSRDAHNNSSSSLKGRRGQLMSASKLGKIVNGKQAKNSVASNQRERIKKIYNPGNQLVAKHSSNNIMVSDEFPFIQKNNPKSGVNSSLSGDNRTKNMRYGKTHYDPKSSHSINKTGEWKVGKYKEYQLNSEMIKNANAMLPDSEEIRREGGGVDDYVRVQRNEGNSQSLLGNLSGGPNKNMIGTSSRENSTVSIRSKKNTHHPGYEQSLSNMIKYDTTAVISEEYSNYEDPFTQMYTNSILSA